MSVSPSRSPPPGSQRGPSSPSIHGTADLYLPLDLHTQPAASVKLALQVVHSAWEGAKGRAELGRAFAENSRTVGALVSRRPPILAGLLIAVLQTLHTLIRLTPRPAINETAGDLIAQLCDLSDHLHTLGAEWSSARSGVMLLALNMARAGDASILRSRALDAWQSEALHRLRTDLIGSDDSVVQLAALASDATKLLFVLLERHDRSATAFVSGGVKKAASALVSAGAAKFVDSTQLRFLELVALTERPVEMEVREGEAGTVAPTPHVVEPPREGDTFTRAQVAEFIAAMAAQYQAEQSAMRSQRQLQLDHIQQLEEQLEEIATVTAVLRQSNRS